MTLCILLQRRQCYFIIYYYFYGINDMPVRKYNAGLVSLIFFKAEINFLCVHKTLRAKRLAPVLIKEVTRRVNRCNMW